MQATNVTAKVYAEPTADDQERIRVMHEDALRIIDRQTAACEGLDTKLGQLLRVSLAGLAGALALCTLLVERMPPTASWQLRVATFVLILLGAGANIASALDIIEGWGGLQKRQPTRREAPHPAWLSDQIKRAKWPLWEYRTAVVHAAKKAYAANDREARRVVNQRRKALHKLLLAGILYAAAALFIIASAILLP